MKITLVIIIAAIISGCTKEQPTDIDSVIRKFNDHTAGIRAVEYRAQRIDTFPESGAVWNNSGIALIEKNDNDKTFGFSFYGKRDDVTEGHLYHNEIGFAISEPEKAYETHEGTFAFLGSPGGQMIHPGIFHLDSVYKSITLIVGEGTFTLKYEFEDNEGNDVTDRVKMVELRKEDFFPVRFTAMSKVMGRRNFSQTILTDIRLNQDVKSSIDEIRNGIRDYSIVQSRKSPPNPLLDQKIPVISLPDLTDESKAAGIATASVTLIDFWEPWCGPCIASLPKIESLKAKYSSQLDLVGIVCDDKEAAISILERKGITFRNLAGNRKVRKEFGVHRWPTYFLIDKDGTMLKEYFGFSEEIEKDIAEVLER